MATRRINQDLVVETAEALIDRDGWLFVTMTGLAKKLGVRTPALYTHVDSLEALLGEVQVRAHGDLANRYQRAAMGKTGSQAFRALADVLRAYATEHPGLYELAMSDAIDRAAVLAASEPSDAALTAVIESFGIAHSTSELHMNCLATLHGVLALDRTGLFQKSVDLDDVYTRAVDMVISMLEREGR